VNRSFERLVPYIGRALGLSEEELTRACRPAVESEIQSILSLRRSVLTDVWWDDERFVRWRYFSRSATAEAPYWVFARNREILGACGLEPVTLVVDGVAMPAVRTLDIMVRPDLDGLGLGAFINLALFRRFPIALVTGSNERSHSLLTRMFQHTVDLRFWKLPIRARAVLDAKVAMGPLAAVLAPPLDLFLAARRRLHQSSVPAGITIRDIQAFDPSVEELSRTYERSGRVIVRRTAEYLNWRFVQNPRCRYRIVGAFAGNRLEGYVVTRLNLARPNPRREAEIVDWMARPSDASSDTVLAALLHEAVHGLTRAGAGIISCAVATSDSTSAIEAAGFSFRPAERLPFFVKASDPALHSRLTVGADWFITRGDFDVE